MKKHLPYLPFILTMVLLFTSCSSARYTRGNNEKDTPTPRTVEKTPIVSQSPVKESEKPIDSGLTLEGIKKAAQDAGYEVEALQSMQMGLEPDPVDGFSFVYKDENSEAYIPVYEFKNTDDAQDFARQVNEAGYNLCIMNGKFLTMTGANYGIVLNDKQNSVLEKLLQSKVMEYTEPSPAQKEYTKDFAGACAQITELCKALDKLVNRNVLLYNKTLSAEDPNRFDYVTFSPLLSSDLSFVATMCEDQAKLDAVVELWEMFGCTNVKLKHDTPHDYTLTGKRSGLETTFEIHCAYSPEKSALLLVDTDGGQVFEIYEFLPIGKDKYAFQTKYERGIVEYKDGKIVSFVYSLNKQDESLAYDISKDGIYPDGQGTDEAWVLKNGEDSYEQYISFDGKMLKIAADSFMSGRIRVDIEVK